MPIKKIKAQSPDPYVGKTIGDTEFARLAHLNNIVDQINNNNSSALSYKVYTALLNQSGTNPPTAEVLENTFGGAVTFEYIQLGSYMINFPIVFPREKVWISLTNNKWGDNAILQYEINGTPLTGFVIHTSKFTLGSPASISLANGCLEYASIEVRVYN